MPSGGVGYPNPGRYWGFLRMTLIEVLNETPPEADMLVQELQYELNTASADEQLFFFHYEPFEVALTITNQTPTSDIVGKYATLVRRFGWAP
jgi:hypothetical protein